MEIDLNKISKENKEKLLKIINEENIGFAPSSIELKNISNKQIFDKILNQPPQQIELDSSLEFENAILDIKNGLKRNTSADKETYRALTLIHSKGVNNFWQEVKRIVESKKEIDVNDCSDIISNEYLK